MGVIAVAIVLAVGGGGAAAVSPAIPPVGATNYGGIYGDPANSPLSPGPVVTYTNTAPTGYTVTFNLYDPGATNVDIHGSWSFSNVANSNANAINSNPILPAQWQPGDFPLQDPDAPSENWPINAMTLNPATGIWSYTIPLPPGVFDYQFYPNCTKAGASGCASISDPGNLPWNTTSATFNGTGAGVGWTYVTNGSVEIDSQVYVPSDAAFGSTSQSWEAPVPANEQGTLVDIAIPNGTGTDRVVVYTPPGFNPNRTPAYPLWVEYHGGGENDITSSTRGNTEPIVDNSLAAGTSQPMVIVDPNGSSTSEILNSIIPYMAAHYDTSTSPNNLAISGNSAQGTTVNTMLFNFTGSFGYYGPWSPASGASNIVVTGQGNTAPPAIYNNPLLLQLGGILLADGAQDLGGNQPQLTTQTEREGFINANNETAPVPFQFEDDNGGHTWAFWQLTEHTFVTTMVFKATTTTGQFTYNGSGGTDNLTVKVTPYSTEPATPTGTVTLLQPNAVPGCISPVAPSTACAAPVGAPVALVNGQAVIPVPASVVNAGGTGIIQYSGDNLYSASNGSVALSEAPTTAATVAGTLHTGYYSTAPQVTLSAVEPGGYPIASTVYKIGTDGTNIPYTTPFTVNTGGTNVITFHSTDTNGNVEATKTLTIDVDTTAPVTTATLNPAPVAGVVTGIPTVTLTATDPLSSIVSTMYSVNGAPYTSGNSFKLPGGQDTLTYYSTDAAGNTEGVNTLSVLVDPTATTGASGTVASTLSVSVGATPPSFGAFTPGVAATYTATVGATITTTAQTSTVTAGDTSSTFPGHLVNTAASGGPYDIPEGLQVDATSTNPSATGGGVYSDLSTTSPATVLGYSAPVSNDTVTIGFKQPIAATDPLRTGSYTKTITFTLSTSTP